MAEYVRGDVLVDTQWVADHLNDPKVRIVESDEDILLYEVGHVPGAIKLDWHTDLQNEVVRDFITREEFEVLAAKHGISNDTTVVFYGDRNNWFAVYAFWLFALYGHENMKVMNGGRSKWIAEGRELTNDVPNYPAATYKAKDADLSIRAFRRQVEDHIAKQGTLVDVRSPGEFSGELLHMPSYPQEGVVRGGHIGGAQNIPWGNNANEDGTFKSADDLKALYEGKGVTPEQEIIAYCRIGERSSHTWFTLKYLLGYPNVKNYDGSWTEWGNSVGLPIEKGA